MVSLDRQQYETAIPQLEKRINDSSSQLEGEVTALKDTDSQLDTRIATLAGKAAQITYKDTTVHIGTSQYDGWYFADGTVTTPTGYSFFAATIYSVSDNHLATVNRTGAGTYRVWSAEPNIDVYFIVFYYKAVGE